METEEPALALDPDSDDKTHVYVPPVSVKVESPSLEQPALPEQDEASADAEEPAPDTDTQDDRTQVSVPPSSAKAEIPSLEQAAALDATEQDALPDKEGSTPSLTTWDETPMFTPPASDASETDDAHICPKCGTANPLEPLKKREYRCSKCKLEMAYLDYAANGSIRGIFGWLLAPGNVILERYQVETVLGKGGFGATYLVADQQLNGKRRALKEVPELMFDEYEASLLIKLDHPAIPDIIERRAVGGMFYMVLKFGGSRTLGAERKQSPDKRIPEAKLLPWMRQLSEVLIYLHGQTPPIIHRDLKPDNILLNEDERIMLIDFGIAKESMPETLTRTLARAMSPGFSSLEQIIGNRTDERSDIYSLGATFYALLTGLKPPGADERVSGKRLIPPSEILPDVSPNVEAAIIQSLNLNINDRQQTMKEFFAQAFGVYESGSNSRPIDAERTRALGLDGGATVFAHHPDDKTKVLSSGSASTQGAPASKLLPILAGLAATAAVLGGGAYYLLSKPTPTSALAPATTTVASTPKPTIPAPVPETQPANPAPETTPAVQPTVVAAPPSPGMSKPAEEQLIDYVPHLTSFPITLSQTAYREQDNIEFTLDLPQPGYLHVFILEPGGKATLIFPNKMVPNNQVQAGKLKLPNGKPPLNASPPYGKSWFIALTEPHPNNLYQQYTKDGKKNLFFVEMTAWQLLGFLQDRLSDKEAKASGAEMRVCAKTGACE